MDVPTPPAPAPVPVAPIAPVPLKHSWLGIVSFILSIGGGLAMLLLFGVAGYMQMSTPGGMDEKSGSAILVGLLLFAVAGILLVGVGLGIGALFQKERKKVFAILGLVFNALVILGTLGLIVLGNTME